METTGDLLFAVARGLRRATADAMAERDITPGQARALRVVGEQGPLRLSALAERLRMAPRSITEVVGALETAELVTRGPDPSDRRATQVAVTEAGVVLDAELSAVRRQVSERFLADLPAADRADLDRVLRRLVRVAAETSRRT